MVGIEGCEAGLTGILVLEGEAGVDIAFTCAYWNLELVIAQGACHKDQSGEPTCFFIKGVINFIVTGMHGYDNPHVSVGLKVSGTGVVDGSPYGSAWLEGNLMAYAEQVVVGFLILGVVGIVDVSVEGHRQQLAHVARGKGLQRGEVALRDLPQAAAA